MSGRPLPGEESRPAPSDDPGATRAAVPSASPALPAPPALEPGSSSREPDRSSGEPGRSSREPGPPSPEPPPLEANDQLVTAVITAGWAVALVVLLILHADLPPAQRWWIWTTVAGFGMGLFGLFYVPFLKRARARAAQRPKRPRP